MSDIDYVKDDKVYKVKKQPWQPRKVRVWLLVPLVLMMMLGVYVVFSSMGVESTGLTEYNVAGDIDYKVYLKDNDYYTEKFLEPGMQYIANLISAVRADFNYELDANENIDANYEYEIVAEAKATDRSDKSKILYERTDTLKTGKITPVEGGEIKINDKVDIDYQKYSDYMRAFRSDFGIAANCFLDLKMIVRVDGAIKTEDTLAMNIPLSDQTIDIAIDTKAINREEKIGNEVKSVYVKNLPLLITGIVIVLASLGLIVVIIYLYKTRYNGSLYEKALYKILKEYDTYIVNATETIYELENVMRVENFKELLDASQAESSPIVFLEVVPGEKAYFVVNGMNTTYRYTLSRAYQDRLASSGEKEY